jgi:hypothetical protein
VFLGNATGLRNRTAHLTESVWCGVRYRVLREVRGNFRELVASGGEFEHRTGIQSSGVANRGSARPINVGVIGVRRCSIQGLEVAYLGSCKRKFQWIVFR